MVVVALVYSVSPSAVGYNSVVNVLDLLPSRSQDGCAELIESHSKYVL